jgi:hypothetical protein
MELEHVLADSASDYEQVQKLSEELTKINSELEEKTLRWMEIQEEMQ